MMNETEWYGSEEHFNSEMSYEEYLQIQPKNKKSSIEKTISEFNRAFKKIGVYSK